MNFALISFIIIAILAIAFGSYYFVSSGRMVGGIVYLIGSILVFVFYGLRWFGTQGTPLNPSPVQWPPYINTCPDYLTYYKRTQSNGTVSDTCIDRIGVSRNNSLDVFPADGNVNPDNDKYFFPLATQSQDPDGKRTELCKRVIQYGLTWEGVSDGETCYSASGTGQAVVPSGGASGGASGCPSS
jgi:hypothetical protein